jgi:hypothetical protein
MRCSLCKPHRFGDALDAAVHHRTPFSTHRTTTAFWARGPALLDPTTYLDRYQCGLGDGNLHHGLTPAGTLLCCFEHRSFSEVRRDGGSQVRCLESAQNLGGQRPGTRSPVCSARTPLPTHPRRPLIGCFPAERSLGVRIWALPPARTWSSSRTNAAGSVGNARQAGGSKHLSFA